MKKENYVFFWNGEFSQWYIEDITIGGIVFNCCEQYMMYRKAMTFGDTEAASRILATNQPRLQKVIGREVKNFDAAIWNPLARDIVKDANYAKFSQHQYLKETLFKTEAKIIVEASPEDSIWGIGFDAAEAMDNIGKWGTNWLGEAIMQVRTLIRYEESLKWRSTTC